MEKGDKKTSILLDGGLADRRPPGLRAPVAQQMSSPALAKSDNTRLSIVRGSAVRAPGVTSIATGLPSECHGIIPAGNLESTALLFRGAHQRSALGFSAVRHDRSYGGYNFQTVPARVAGLGGTGAIGLASAPCVQVDQTNGRVWHAALTRHNFECWLTIVEPDGSAALRPSNAFFPSVPASTARWLSLTSHAADVMCAWIVRSGVGLRFVKLTYNPATGTVSAGAETTVVLPASANVWYDVKSLDDNHVVIVTGHPVTNTSTRIIKYNVNTATVSATVDVAGTGTTIEHACAVETVSGSLRVAVVIASASLINLRVFLYDSALSPVWGPITHSTAAVGAATRVGIGFHSMPSAVATAPQVTVCSEHAISSFSSLGAGGMQAWLTHFDYATGAVNVNESRRTWKRLVSTGCQVKWSAGEFTPAFLLHTAFSPAATTPASVDYVDDPALELWMGSEPGPDDWHPVARIGCVRGSASPFDGSVVADRPSSSACGAKGSSVWVDYRTASVRYDSIGNPLYTFAYARVDMSAAQLFTTADRDGAATAAGGLPLYWDGSRLMEYGGPLSRPHLHVASAGGIGPAYAAGAYSAIAIYSWRDAAGGYHRSRPSNVVTWTSSGGSPIVYVSHWRGFTKSEIIRSEIEIEVYVTPVNQPDFHRLPFVLTGGLGIYTLTSSNVPAPLASDPILYSTGEFGQELTPQPPPPLRDVTIVGSRMWGIDAEFPYRLVYSKLRVAGVGYEFHPALEAYVPSVGGEAQRVFELAGTTVVLAERAVWQFTGFGPDNNGQGGTFSPPIKLSDYGCSAPHAAAAFPGGLIWQSADRWYVMRGGAVQQLQDVKVGMTVTHSLTFADQDEIAFYGTQTAFDPNDTFGPAIAKVYNYVLDRWSRWNALAFTHVASSPNESRRHYAFHNGTLYKIDAEALADSASMVFEIDLLNLAGDFQDHVLLRDVVFYGQRLGAHGVTIEVFPDHGASPTTTRTFADAAITSAMTTAGTTPWYSLRVEPKDQDMRAVKVRITLTVSGTGEGGRPLSLTLYFAPLSPLREEVFGAGSSQ